MNLYLVRHGDALMKEQDSLRPLSEEGRAEIECLAEKLRPLEPPVDQVLHSPKIRAKQTAELLCEYAFSELTPVETDGLLPEDPIHDWIHRLPSEKSNLMLVGHLPFMGLMAQALLSAERVSEITFVTGTLIWLERTEEGWKLKDVLQP